MSDPNQFINTYIDTIMATLHEYLGSSLQHKTQLKISSDLLAEKDSVIANKDAVIAGLVNEVEQFRANVNQNDVTSGELSSCQEKLRIAEDSHNALKVKVSHMDTLTNQLSEMKSNIISKTGQIATLTEQVDQLTTDLKGNRNRVIELDSLVLQRDEVIANKEKEISALKEKLELLLNPPKLPEPSPKVKVAEPLSSAVKVQLNTKNKAKELPKDTDDF